MDRKTVINYIKQTICEVLNIDKEEVNWDLNADLVSLLEIDSFTIFDILLGLESSPLELDLNEITNDAIQTLNTLVDFFMENNE